MVYSTWSIQLADPLGVIIRSVKICLDIEGLNDIDPVIINHPQDLLDALESLSECHSIDYTVYPLPYTLTFVSIDDEEYDLDPIWTGTWESLSIHQLYDSDDGMNDLYMSDIDTDSEEEEEDSDIEEVTDEFQQVLSVEE